MPFSQLFRSKKHHSSLPAPLLPQKITTKQNKKYDKWLTKSAYSKAKQVFLGFVFEAVGINFVSAFIETASYRSQSEDELENKLQTIHHKFQVTLKALHPQQKWSNVDDADKKNFKELKEKNYVYLPSKGWRSGESARLPPMWPGFKSRRPRHMWVEFVFGSLLCSERFSSGYCGFPLFSKTNTSFKLDLGRTGTFKRVHMNS